MKIKGAKIIRIGGSMGFTIPSNFIKHGLISIEKKYNIELTEVKN